MVVCSNCGAHYSEEFLQCPQCGSTKRKTNNSVVGFLITLAIVGVLAGIAGYGIYLLFHPLEPESAIEDTGPTVTTTETSSTSSTTTTTTTTTARVTTTKLVGQDETPIGDKHTYTRPEGYTVVEIPEEVVNLFGEAQGMECLYNASNERYCLNILEDKNLVLDNTKRAELNTKFTSMGYSELISIRLFGSTYYYFYRNEK